MNKVITYKGFSVTVHDNYNKAYDGKEYEVLFYDDALKKTKDIKHVNSIKEAEVYIKEYIDQFGTL